MASSSRDLVCVCCPLGCAIEAEINAGDLVAVRGNKCKRGLAWASQEITAPERVVTAVVPIEGSLEPLSVKTSSPIPKSLIHQVLAQILALKLQAPVVIGDVVIDDVCGTGVPVVATKSIF